jgi:hypothetical protein
MTAQQLAEMVQARPTGRGRWTARCPSHSDRNPSLSIRQGTRGVLVRCWSQNCSVESIANALGLRVVDLFNGWPLTPEKAAQAALESAALEQWRRQCRAVERSRVARVRDLENVVDGLCAKLACDSENAVLGGLFHRTVAKLHELETAVDHRPPELGGKRLESPSESVEWVSAALMDIGASFKTQTGATRCEQAASQKEL